MKKIITLLLFAISFTLINAQKNSDLSIEHLNTQQNRAIDDENYELAAKYKKAIVLKGELKEAVAAEDWDKAAEIKEELNDINFKSGTSKTKYNDEYYDIDGLASSSDREIMEGGFFLDGMLGAGIISDIIVNNTTISTFAPNLALGFQFGTKWHFGEGRVYRPGLQMTWLRLGIQKAATNTFFSFNLYPVNVGYASIFGFSDNMGLEINLNLGLGLNFWLGDFPDDIFVHTGLHINPNVKFRYKALAVGFDVSTLNGPIINSSQSRAPWFSNNIYSITFGGKF